MNNFWVHSYIIVLFFAFIVLLLRKIQPMGRFPSPKESELVFYYNSDLSKLNHELKPHNFVCRLVFFSFRAGDFFEISNTPKIPWLLALLCCDLLLNLYLWNIKYTSIWLASYQSLLWFAFKFVSLKYQIHHATKNTVTTSSCDLLLNLYLWNIKYTSASFSRIGFAVVICF